MRIMKRWLTLMLTASILLSDYGSTTVFATGDTVTAETLDSGNDGEGLQTDDGIVPDEFPYDNEILSEDETVKSEDAAPANDTETILPALHIGQIDKGEELPAPDDSEFVYDLPVSFERADSVLLFADYNIDAALEIKEKGTLVWSILRGENGTEEGSTCLVNEEDDWVGFEVVPDSPYFTMTENEDEESDYYQTVELTARDIADDVDYTDYNYYIRAVLYFGTGEERAEKFYAASTVAFLPIEDTDTDEAADDAPATEEIDIEEVSEDVSVTEEVDTEEVQENVSVAEENYEEQTADNALLEEESYVNSASEEDDDESKTDERYESDEQKDLNESVGNLTLYITDKDKPMEPDDTRQVTAKLEYEDEREDVPIEPSEIEWASSDEDVAAVDKDGVVSAKAEGYAQISAKYNDMTSYVMVEVACNGGTEKLLDLSDDIWVVGFQQESEDFVYTGQKITQDIRVYHNETLLKEKTDYTLTYKNNVNAAAYDSAKAPSVTIKFKGQYSGSRTLYYTIQPRDIDENGTMGYEQVVQYAKTLNIPAPTLYYNNKKLTSKKDFVCDYTDYDESSAYNWMPEDYKKGDLYKPGEIYEYTVNGTGNFKGSFKMRLVMLKDKTLNLGNASVTLDKKQYEYHGSELTKTDVTISSVKFSKALVEDKYYEYEVYAAGVGTGYIEVYPSEEGRNIGYRGTKKVNFKVIGDRKIKDAVTVDRVWQPEIAFSQKSVNENGGMIQAGEGVLVYCIEDEEAGSNENGNKLLREEPLKEGEDYTVKYSNHKKVGTATVTYTGMGRYTGSLKKTYKITPNTGKGENFKILWKNVTRNTTAEGEAFEIEYQKGGAVPDFVLMDQDENVLKNKTDYTVKLTDNKSAGSAMTCSITGKGNYKGYSASKQIKVTLADIGKGTISVADKQYSTKSNAWKSDPTIKDVNGKTLTAGVDYAKEFEYVFDYMVDGGTPKARTTVTITVHGINNYEGSVITGEYRIYEKNISKLKITIDAQEYTGKEITLTKKNIHIYATSSDQKNKKNELPGTCYEIIEGGYKNNIKAGTAKVTLQGIGDYGGTKTYSFKISKKAYLVNQVKGISLDKTSISLSLQGKDDDKRILKATIKPADAKVPLTNPTIIWSTSNSNIADVEGGPITETTVTAHIVIKKTGSVTITATAQDGGKKASCTVTVVDVPILEDDGRIITMNLEDKKTYQLKFENDETQEPNLSGITWTISNSDVVSVNKEKRLLTAKKPGVAVLKLTKSKFVQQCYVIVEGDEEEIPETYHKFKQTPNSDDDTDSIRKAIYSAYRDNTCDGIYIPAGVYWVDATANANNGIFLDGRTEGYDVLKERDDFEIRFSTGALIMTKPNNVSNDFHVISIVGCSNITVSGGTIIGERNEHKGKSGESGHGIALYNCKNTRIRDMDISQCWGDGIYLGRMNYTRNLDNVNITITNCNIHNNRRNNLSITSANGVTISNCKFNYAKGTDPQFGIDIETNTSRACKNITVRNTIIEGNAKGSVGIMTAADSVTFEDCTLSGNFYNWAGTNVTLRRVTFNSGDLIDNCSGVTVIKK